MKITRQQLRKLIKEALKIGDYEIPTPLPPGAVGSKASHRQRAIDPDLLGSLSGVEKIDPHSASELALSLGSGELPLVPPGFEEKHKDKLQALGSIAYPIIRNYFFAMEDMFANPDDYEKMRLAGDLRQEYDNVRKNLDHETFSKYSRRAGRESRAAHPQMNPSAFNWRTRG